MSKKGRLTLDQFGPSMPVTAPAVQSPPFFYRNMEMMIITYKTSDEAALDILPDGLELADPATAVMIIADYHWSTFGPYQEAILCIACTWKGKPMLHLPNLFVTQEAPLIAGREIWGYAKKLANIELYQQSEEYIGIIERPKGNRIATGIMRTVDNVPADEFTLNPITSLKVIPDAEQGEKPAIAQLVSCDFDVKPVVGTDGLTELWSGPGSLVYNSPSHNDPWYKLSVEEVIQCQYGYFNAYLPYGKILKNYI